MRFITKQFHAYIDYPVAIVLFVLPFLLGFTGPALWISVATGLAAFSLTLLTNHQTGALKLIPYSWHLAVDGLVGLTFVLLPFVLGFGGLEAIYYWVNGAAVLTVVALHKPETTTSPLRAVA